MNKYLLCSMLFCIFCFILFNPSSCVFINFTVTVRSYLRLWFSLGHIFILCFLFFFDNHLSSHSWPLHFLPLWFSHLCLLTFRPAFFLIFLSQCFLKCFIVLIVFPWDFACFLDFGFVCMCWNASPGFNPCLPHHHSVSFCLFWVSNKSINCTCFASGFCIWAQSLLQWMAYSIIWLNPRYTVALKNGETMYVWLVFADFLFSWDEWAWGWKAQTGWGSRKVLKKQRFWSFNTNLSL